VGIDRPGPKLERRASTEPGSPLRRPVGDDAGRDAGPPLPSVTSAKGGIVLELIIVIVVLVILVGLLVAAYNRLVRARVRVDEAWAQVDTQLQRRHDLIPNLVNTVKGYASHERETLEAVTAARAKAISVQGPADLAEAENGLTQALGKLLAITENYPDLKADANFRQLQEELAHTENMVAGSRGHYNASVRAYDETRQVFPTSVIAGMFNFEGRDYFEVDTVEVRAAPDVSFD
jgi:LemA protein